MKTKELRLGNWIKIDRGLGRIVSLKTKEYETWSTDSGYPAVVGIQGESYFDCTEDEIEGIALTEDILIKCGFESFTTQYYGVLYSLKRHTKGRKLEAISIFLNTGRISICGNLIWNKCNYLHQLQNLYYAIQGKELRIKM